MRERLEKQVSTARSRLAPAPKSRYVLSDALDFAAFAT